MINVLIRCPFLKINGVAGGANIPFGGVKQSGFGKEAGQYALEA